jgi:protein O-mannosyl-transferase
MLLALLAHVSFLENRRRCFMMASLAAFALALLSKESAVVFPVVVAVLTLALTRRLQIVLSSAAPLVAVLAGYAALRWLLFNQFVGGYGTHAHLGWDGGRIVFLIVHSSARVLLPPLPSVVADLLARNSYMSPLRWLALLVGGSLPAALAVWSFRNRSWRAGWQLSPALVASFCLSLPLLGNLSVSLSDTQGERFLYFPSVFVVTAAVCLAARVPRHRRLLTISIGAWILASSVGLWHVNGTWAAAGRLSEKLATEAAVLANSRIVIITNVPDTYRGVYVFRNGFWAAVTIFRHPVPSVEHVEVLSTHPVRSLQEEVTVKKADAGWSVEFLGDAEPETRFAPDVAILWRSAHAFGFEPIRPGAEILSYSAGRMWRVTQ